MKQPVHQPRTQSNKPYCDECETTSDIANIKQVYRTDIPGTTRTPSRDKYLCDECITESSLPYKIGDKKYCNFLKYQYTYS